jgi:hypothetical protein
MDALPESNMELNHRFNGDAEHIHKADKGRSEQREKEVRPTQTLDVRYTRLWNFGTPPPTDPSAEIHSISPYHCFRCNLAVLMGGSFCLFPSWIAQWRPRT